MSDLCAQCKRIPDSLDVETMHTPDRLPKEVDALEIIGGRGSDYALGQVRVCPACKTHYLYFHDHDSESGVGSGYTDESIKRVSTARAREAIEKNIKVLDDIIERLLEELKNTDLKVIHPSMQKRLAEDKREREQLKEHLKSLGD